MWNFEPGTFGYFVQSLAGLADGHWFELAVNVAFTTAAFLVGSSVAYAVSRQSVVAALVVGAAAFPVFYGGPLLWYLSNVGAAYVGYVGISGFAAYRKLINP